MWTAISSIAVALVATFPKCLGLVLEASRERAKALEAKKHKRRFNKHSHDKEAR